VGISADAEVFSSMSDESAGLRRGDKAEIASPVARGGGDGPGEDDGAYYGAIMCEVRGPRRS